MTKRYVVDFALFPNPTDFRILEPFLEQMNLSFAKIKTGRQRKIHYNPNWQYLKEKAKEILQSEEGKHIYSCRKSDVEPIFGHMKRVFGMRRTHI